MLQKIRHLFFYAMLGFTPMLQKSEAFSDKAPRVKLYS